MDATEHDPMACGLSSAAASALQQQYGLNRLSAAHAPRWWQQLLAQFRNTLIAILLAAALLSLVLGHLVDGAVIGAVILINTMLGFIQENRAEKAVQTLQSFLAPQVLVCRDGAWQQLPAEALVPDDWVRVENGARISADMRLLEAHALRVDESLLTGESVPVDKTTSGDAGELLLWAGTLVTGGDGVGQVTATGSATEIGRIHQLMGTTLTMRSPLLERISRLSRTLAFIVVLLAAIAAGIAWWRGEALEFALLAAISLAVAIIPEGLPAIISVTLALGVQRMAQRGAIVRQLPAVETLGTVTVICTDKTGTLTENRMTVQELALADDSPALLQRALRVMILCNDAQLRNDKSGIGDPLEQALLRYAGTHGADVDVSQMESPRVDARPFSHEQPFMATRHSDGIAIKGAPEWVLQRCQRMATASGVAEVDPAYWHKVIADMA
ncbi:HAD-IC family P-type ATPase, partial [Acidithiobacillus sp.]|uniref:cation-translocating P-type ATPase n=1 Tax=Acidithiobacillus sp. TaxID=1872118 RepID=UPI00260DFC09